MHISKCIITVNHVIYIHSSIYPCLLFLSMTQFLCHQAFNQALLSTSAFPPKIKFLYSLLSSATPWSDPMVETEGKFFGI